MNRREFLKKGLEGIIVSGIPFISGCGKNPVDLKREYAPGGLIIKFTVQAFSHKDFNIRVEEGIVITGLKSIDSLNTYYKAESFKNFLGRDITFQFPSYADMKYIASVYEKDSNIEYAHPNWLYYAF